VTDLHWASVSELSRSIATKEVSPVEVVRAHLERIAALDARLRCFITVTGEAALERARAAEAALAGGKILGPLHGVPFALKDLFDTAGVRTTGGSKILADRVPAEDATVVGPAAPAPARKRGQLNKHKVP
jgi:Asp-tRNA(Asn)/Glu-tRNA(Gln) amidotransferase A subunit family amidase